MSEHEMEVGMKVEYNNRMCLVSQFHFDKKGKGRVEITPSYGSYFWVNNNQITKSNRQWSQRRTN